MKKETKYNLLFVITFFAVIFGVISVLYLWVKNLLILLYDI